jgi:hypothetical protein
VVHLRRHLQRLAFAIRQALFSPPLLIESHGPIYTPDTLVVPVMAPVPERAEALPEPPASVALDNVVECINDRSIGLRLLLCCILAIPGTAGKIDEPTGTGDGQRPDLGQVLGRPTAVGRPQSFPANPLQAGAPGPCRHTSYSTGCSRPL